MVSGKSFGDRVSSKKQLEGSLGTNGKVWGREVQ